MKRATRNLSLALCLACSAISGQALYGQQTTQEAKDINVFAMQTGNPVIPAYLADATIIYDQKTDMFYAYGTNDGAGGGNVYPTQM
jgi:hypothetical protein